MAKSPSGYRFHVRVDMNDGTKLDVQTKLTDVLRWEQNNGGQGFMVFPMPLDRLLWVIWAAGRRLGLVTGTDQAGWAAQVADFELLDDDDEIPVETAELDPTSPAQ